MTEHEYNAIAMLSEANAALRLAIDAINDAIPHIFPDGSDLLLEAIAKIEKQAEKNAVRLRGDGGENMLHYTRPKLHDGNL